MGLKELNIKLCYESGVDDIIEDFYEPALGSSIQYDRIAGFFSSSALAVAARGLSNFIKNDGKMRLITSPRLNKEDWEIIKRIEENSTDIAISDFGINFDNMESEFVSNHVKALGWMLSKGLLDMRMAIVYNNDGTILEDSSVLEQGLFHQKVGILKDKYGDEISFSGSINETASAWINNDEEFKVFKSWTNSDEYFIRDKERFEEMWNGNRKNIKVYKLPDAIKLELIHYSSGFDIRSISFSRYCNDRCKEYNFENDKNLFFYQAKALNKWKDNGYKLLFEMATGTGKTRTAIAGIQHLCDKKKKLVTIISTPQNTLSKQWKKEIEEQHIHFDKSEIIDGSVRDWETLFIKSLYKHKAGFYDLCVFYTTHNTASSVKFTNAISQTLDDNAELLFVGDETHWLGAPQLQKALLSNYKYRIGLSATPSRWYDDDGTQKLIQFYGNDSFGFSIKDALTEFNPLTGKHFLVNYNYLIYKASLNEEESKEYNDITAKISKLWKAKDKDPDTAARVDRLLLKRSNIIKNADSKYSIFSTIIDELKTNGKIHNLLIFVSPQQIERVMSILDSKDLIFHKLTEEEGTRPENRFGGKSERENIISNFKIGNYQAIVAIKCMDEGIDIPTADTGILLSSSTNPREYIQRIGRIIRQSPGKMIANLYDICVDTISKVSGEELLETERRIKAKEQVRLKEIASNAINSIDALKIINTLD